VFALFQCYSIFQHSRFFIICLCVCLYVCVGMWVGGCVIRGIGRLLSTSCWAGMMWGVVEPGEFVEA
jgi:hypothetical protein